MLIRSLQEVSPLATTRWLIRGKVPQYVGQRAKEKATRDLSLTVKYVTFNHHYTGSNPVGLIQAEP